MADTPRQRISIVTAILMLAVAIMIDGAQFLLVFIPGVDVVLDFFLGILGDMVFGVWFFLSGVNYFGGTKSGSKLAAMFATAIIEAVPLLDALPGLTFGVAAIIWATRAEDRQKIANAPPVITPSRPVPAYRMRYIDDQAGYDPENMPEAANDNEEFADEDDEYQEAA